MRNHQSYFGHTAQPFVALTEFELQKNSLRMVFEGFASIEKFDRGDEPLGNLRREFLVNGPTWEEWQSEYADVIASIRENCLAIAQVPTTYSLDYVHLLTVKWVLVLSARSAAGDDQVIRTKTAPEYHEIILANRSLVEQVLVVAWQFGKQHDPFLAILDPVN